MSLSLLSKIEAVQPFKEREAWGLFRIAAIGEAVGWTFLITGILINRYRLPGHAIAIPIAGQVHGTLFLIYFGILVAAYSSLQWSRRKFLVAALAGVIPFGTLVFEQWAALTRRNKLSQTFCYSTALVIIADQL